MSNFQYINKPADLNALLPHLRDSGFLAIDTEFERINTYYPKLCLIQISNGEQHAIIDPLAIDDLGSLYDLFYDASIMKVLHSAHQDLEILFNLHHQIPQPLFDTQIAASFAGHVEGIGYANLVKAMLDVELDKDHARTDWTKRPLSEDQCLYAINDVIYLAKIFPMLNEKLISSDSYTLFQEKMARLTKEDTYVPDPDRMWKKIFAARRLKGKQLNVLKDLAAWRELKARERNRPRKWILADDVLINLARKIPMTREDLNDVEKMNEKAIGKYGDSLLTIFHNYQD